MYVNKVRERVKQIMVKITETFLLKKVAIIKLNITINAPINWYNSKVSFNKITAPRTPTTGSRYKNNAV